MKGFPPSFCGLYLQDGRDDLNVGQKNQEEWCHKQDNARNHNCNLIGGGIYTSQSDHSKGFTGYMINMLIGTRGQLKGDGCMHKGVDEATDPRYDDQSHAQPRTHDD